jgi:hypothetical protein
VSAPTVTGPKSDVMRKSVWMTTSTRIRRSERVEVRPGTLVPP